VVKEFNTNFRVGQGGLIEINGNFTINPSNKPRMVEVDATAGPVTVTLPLALGIGGKRTCIIKTDSSSNVVTIAANAADTVNGAATDSVSAQFENVDYISDNENAWLKVGVGSGGGGGGVSLDQLGVCDEWWIYDEMIHPTLAGVLTHWITNPSLIAGTFVVPVARGGVVRFGTASNNTNNAVNLQTCAGGGTIIIDGGKFLYRARVKLQDATGSIFYVGGMGPQLPQGNNAVTLAQIESNLFDGVYIRMLGNVDTNFQCVSEVGNVQTVVDSGVAIDNLYHCYDIESDGTSVVFKIDGNVVATITTNIPTGVNLIVGQQVNSLTIQPSNNRTMDIDFMFVYSLNGRE